MLNNTKKFKVQNTGRPYSGHIPQSAWKDLSEHASLKSALGAISKNRAHLSYGSWDDHYRIIWPKSNHVYDMYNCYKCEQAGYDLFHNKTPQNHD